MADDVEPAFAHQAGGFRSPQVHLMEARPIGQIGAVAGGQVVEDFDRHPFGQQQVGHV